MAILYSLITLVCSTSLMASLIRSVGGLSKCFYQGLCLADLNADVTGQSIVMKWPEEVRVLPCVF